MGVEQSRLEESPGWASLETSHARPASFGDRVVGRQIQVRDDLGEEKKRPELRVDEQPFLPIQPSPAAAARERSGSGVESTQTRHVNGSSSRRAADRATSSARWRSAQ
jgi:hypothetical protein